MCKILRVLNAVRSPEIGVPLSIQQYKVFKAYLSISLGAKIGCIDVILN